MQIHVSNQLEKLAKNLSQLLLRGNIFTPRYLIVPTKQMRSWIQKYLCDNNVISGFSIYLLEDAVLLFLRTAKKNLHFMDSLYRKISIYEQINFLKKDEKYPILESYLSQDDSERIIYLTHILSKLFHDYGIYGSTPSLNNKIKKSWQEEVFHKIYNESAYTYPLEQLPLKTSIDISNKEVYLFGFSYIPEVYFDLFYTLSKNSQVHFFYCRCTQQYFEDLISSREKKYIYRKIPLRKSPEREWIYDMMNINPLCANWASLGKRFEKILGNYEVDFEENYQTSFSPTLLGAIQKDIMELSVLDEKNPVEIKEEGVSIVIQNVQGSLWHEVKNLWENIHYVLSTEDILLEDIVVLAPNISQYFPYIQAIFQTQPGLIDYKVDDLGLACVSSLAKAILHIIDWIVSEGGIKELFLLLENPLLKKKCQFIQSDLDFFRTILQKIRLQKAGKNEGLKDASLDPIEGRSWPLALEQIIFSFSTFSSEFSSSLYQEGFFSLSNAQLEQIIPYITFLENFYQDMQIFFHKGKAKLSEFSNALFHVINTYFSIDDCPLETAAYQVISSLYRKSIQKTYDIDVTFLFFKDLLLEALNKETISYQGNFLSAVQFARLYPEVIYPEKYVFIIGMCDAEFPLKERKSSLSFSQGNSPSQLEFDRYVFLQALLSAKKMFWVSYPKFTSNLESRENSPSSIIQELEAFLHKYYRIHNKNYSDWVEEVLERNWRRQVGRGEISSPYFASKDFPCTSSINSLQDMSMYEMQLLAQDLSAFHLYKKYGIQFTSNKEEPIDDFFLSPLHMAKVIREGGMLSHEISSILPKGIFKEIAYNQIDITQHQHREKLQLMGICLEKPPFQILIQKNCTGIREEKNCLIVPSIKTNFFVKNLEITGSITSIYSQGIVLYKKNTFQEWLKNWPIILVYSKLCRDVPTLSPQINFVLSQEIIDISCIDFSHMHSFIDFYRVCSHVMPPFLGVYISYFLENNYEGYQKAMQGMEKNKQILPRKSVQWFLDHMCKIIDPYSFSIWAQYLQTIFPKEVYANADI